MFTLQRVEELLRSLGLQQFEVRNDGVEAYAYQVGMAAPPRRWVVVADDLEPESDEQCVVVGGSATYSVFACLTNEMPLSCFINLSDGADEAAVVDAVTQAFFGPEVGAAFMEVLAGSSISRAHAWLKSHYEISTSARAECLSVNGQDCQLLCGEWSQGPAQIRWLLRQFGAKILPCTTQEPQCSWLHALGNYRDLDFVVEYLATSFDVRADGLRLSIEEHGLSPNYHEVRSYFVEGFAPQRGPTGWRHPGQVLLASLPADARRQVIMELQARAMGLG